MKNLLIIFALLVIFSSCRRDNPNLVTPVDERLHTQLSLASNGIGADYYILPNETDFARIPSDPNNPITKAKIELGKFLFHETGLGEDAFFSAFKNTYSCASCHVAKAGFYSGNRQGIAEGGMNTGYAGETRIIDPSYPIIDSVDALLVKSPSILNSAYHKVVLWNGAFGSTGVNTGTQSVWNISDTIAWNFLGFEGLETQAIAGLAVHRMASDSATFANLGYLPYFDAAFPNVPTSERYTRVNAALAIAAYERSVLATKSPFQRWLNGESTAMSNDEKEGAILFFGKGKCYECHNGPSLAADEFYGLGMGDLYGNGVFVEDLVDLSAASVGRGGFTQNPHEIHRFKVPQLYNLRDNAFYGHGGTFTTIRDVIAYKNRAESENQQVAPHHLSEKFIPLKLSNEEIDLIALFLKNALYDPDLMRYFPTSLPSGNCFPNADAQSQIDLGCN